MNCDMKRAANRVTAPPRDSQNGVNASACEPLEKAPQALANLGKAVQRGLETVWVPNCQFHRLPLLSISLLGTLIQQQALKNWNGGGVALNCQTKSGHEDTSKLLMLTPDL